VTITGTDLLAVMQRRFGLPYVLGAKGPGAYDCSGWTHQGCADNGLELPHGTVNQFPWLAAHGIEISLATALVTPGAFLFVWKGPGGGGGGGNHTAFSRGDGTTSEARGRRYGCGSWTARNRGFNHAFLHPDVLYLNLLPPPAPLPPLAPPPPPPTVAPTEDTMRFYHATDTNRFYAVSMTATGLVARHLNGPEWGWLGEPGHELRRVTQAHIDAMPGQIITSI
jgi:cell wall-associated NlpC family hydrolase